MMARRLILIPLLTLAAALISMEVVNTHGNITDISDGRGDTAKGDLITIQGDNSALADPTGNEGSRSDSTAGLIRALLAQRVSPNQILGPDSVGIPIVSGSANDVEPTSTPALQAKSVGLPSGTRGWETIPNVIRNDGLESFRVEVDTNGPVAKVKLEGISHLLTPPEPSPIELLDDGLGADRVAGDNVFTSGPFRFDTSKTMPLFYLHDPTSPSGLFTDNIGVMTIEELDGTTSSFLKGPSFAVLDSDIQETTTVTLSSDVVISPHLINIRSNTHETQSNLRLLGGSLANLTNPIYGVLPDEFDFFMLFSTNKIELLPRTASSNFNAGVHSSVQVNYTGTGLELRDSTTTFGSDGRLLGINVLDAYDRGILSQNATHELVHQWAAHISPSLGLSDGVHYDGRSNVGSLVGGFQWIDDGDGNFTINCDEGRNGAHSAPPLDKYLMGLIDGSGVPTLHTYSGTSLGPLPKCSAGEPVLGEEIVETVTITDIQSIHGVRTPGPVSAQRDFHIAFVAESHDRWLNATEMTFYEILAEHYTKEVLVGDPDPYVGISNWVPITRFFSEGTTVP